MSRHIVLREVANLYYPTTFKSQVIPDEGERPDLNPPEPCEVCGTLVLSRPRSRFRYVYCSWECQQELQRRIRNKRAQVRRRLPDRACARCGERFQPTRSDSRYCSGRCRTAAYRDRRSPSRTVKVSG